MFNNFKSILNRRSDPARSPTRSESLISTTSDDGVENTTNSAEGFLCPTCFHAFPTAESLQNHYETTHPEGVDDGVIEGRDVFNCPACKMKMRSEMELQSHISRHHSSSKEEFEIEAMRMQVKALEEGKARIHTELQFVQSKTSDLEKINWKMKEERDCFELKAAQLSSELANLKANFDDLNSKKVSVESRLKSYEDNINKLEIEIQQRPEADDVNLLKQEIVTVQIKMDQLTSQREAERDTLQKQCDKLQETCLKLQAEKTDLDNQLKIRPTQEEVRCFQDKLSALSLDNSKLQRDIELKESEKKNLQNNLVKFSNFDELKAQLIEKDNLIQNEVRSSTEKLKQIEKLKAELLAEKETVEEMKVSFEKLFAKIEEGEGANTAIVQLQEENTRLHDLLSLEQNAHSQTAKETASQLDDAFVSLSKANSDLKESKDKHKELENELSLAKKDVDTFKTQMQTTSKDLNLQIHNLTASDTSNKSCLKELRKELESTKRCLTEKSEMLENMRKTAKEENETHKKTTEKLDHEKKSVEKRLEELSQMLPVVQSNLMEKEKKLADVEKKLQQSVEQGKAEKENVFRLSNDLQKLRESYEDLNLKFRNMENVMSDSEVIKNEFCDKIAALNEELSKSQSKELELNCALENINEVKSQMNAKVLSLDEENMSLKTCVSILESEKNAVLNDIENVQKDLSSSLEKCKNQEIKIKELKDSYLAEKRKAEEFLEDFESAKELLLSQKVSLQKQMDSLKEENSNNLASVQETLIKVENELTVANEKYSDMKLAMEDMERKYERKEQEWEKMSSHQVGQIGVLSENVKTLKEDWQSEQIKRENLEQKLDDVAGSKLELEAKLDNALDERRGLLERCLRSEAECEKLQKSTSDMRRKYDDSVAALQELGRENLTLQVENMKHITRKWADDSEVHDCTSCKKLFTVTIRKHHCRSCGNIFCNECSTKSATVASSKKPVRVCENCYIELAK